MFRVSGPQGQGLPAWCSGFQGLKAWRLGFQGFTAWCLGFQGLKAWCLGLQGLKAWYGLVWLVLNAWYYGVIVLCIGASEEKY